mmetsp:Transcript_58677/g.137305  ORF Transcript_58677/g.137305 Transcript_58677/m.137305 type:complete len:251 (+) Transcript_58677:155-907(+)
MAQHQVDTNNVASASFPAEPPDSGGNVHNPDGATIVRVENVRQPAVIERVDVQIHESLLSFVVIDNLVNGLPGDLGPHDRVQVLRQSLSRICSGGFDHDPPDQNSNAGVQQALILQAFPSLQIGDVSSSFHGALYEHRTDDVEEDNFHQYCEATIEHAQHFAVLVVLQHILKDWNTHLGVAVSEAATKCREPCSRHIVEQLEDMLLRRCLGSSAQRFSKNQCNHIHDDREKEQRPNCGVHSSHNPMHQLG